MTTVDAALAAFRDAADTITHGLPGKPRTSAPAGWLSCTEAEAIAAVLRAIGEDLLADELLDAHRYGDRSDDSTHSTLGATEPRELQQLVIDGRIVKLTPTTIPAGVIDHTEEPYYGREVELLDGSRRIEYRSGGQWHEFERVTP